MKSLQEKYAPNGICFGCGCVNDKGLKIQSYPEGNTVVCTWMPEPHHEAFPGVLNGGIIGALMDCHSNWTAAYFLMKNNSDESTPCTVTADYSIKLLRPTPSGKSIHMSAEITDISKKRATVEALLSADGKICATCVGTFVAVDPGHPAYHRW